MLRKTHSAIGFVFSLFFLIQGVSAMAFAFEKECKKAIGSKNFGYLEDFHKGRVYGEYKPLYRFSTGLALSYMSLSGLMIYSKGKKRRSKK